MLEQGKLEYTKAVRIAKLEDESARAELLEQAVAEGLSVREIQQRVAELQPSKPKNEAAKLRTRVRTALSKATSSKLMKDPEVFHQLQALVAQLENLIEKAQSKQD